MMPTRRHGVGFVLALIALVLGLLTLCGPG